MAFLEHPIFVDIRLGYMEWVRQRVLANGAVLEVQSNRKHRTPLMWAIDCKQPAIALWLVEHRGYHDVNAAAKDRWTALHLASKRGPLALVKALVAAGANPAALNKWGDTPLICASKNGHTDIVAFLLQLPVVKATINAITLYDGTALSNASYFNHTRIVQLLLDAGANPTVPAGPDSPLHKAYSNNRYAVAALLRDAIDEAERVRILHKARCLLGADAASLACLQGRVWRGQALPLLELTTPQDQHHHQQPQQQPPPQQQKEETAMAGDWYYQDLWANVQGPWTTADMRRWLEDGYFQPSLPVRHGEQGGFFPLQQLYPDIDQAFLPQPVPVPPPRPSSEELVKELAASLHTAGLRLLLHELEPPVQGRLMVLARQQQRQQQHEKLRATAAFALGVSGGQKDGGLCEELYVKLLGYMLPLWADKGPAAF